MDLTGKSWRVTLSVEREIIDLNFCISKSLMFFSNNFIASANVSILLTV